MDNIEEDEQDLFLYNGDGSLDLQAVSEIYNASVAMIADLVTFLEEEGYSEDDFKTWRINYRKRNLH